MVRYNSHFQRGRPGSIMIKTMERVEEGTAFAESGKSGKSSAFGTVSVDGVEGTVLLEISPDSAHSAQVARMRSSLHGNNGVTQSLQPSETLLKQAIDSACRIDHMNIATAGEQSLGQIEHVPPRAPAGAFHHE